MKTKIDVIRDVFLFLITTTLFCVIGLVAIGQIEERGEKAVQDERVYNCIAIPNQEDVSAILDGVNAVRTANGLNILELNDELSNLAAHRAFEYSETKQFTHTINGREFSDFIKDCPLTNMTLIGENLAGRNEGVTVEYKSEQVVKDWINSPSHFKVMTNPEYKSIGIFRGGEELDYYTVTMFGN